jgi:hypothetical protein
MGLFDIFKKDDTKSNLTNSNSIWGQKFKFTKSDNENNEYYFDYGNIFQSETNSIKIGASNNQIDLILKLVDNLEPPYYVLYVLDLSRLDNELGRYQSPEFETRQELQQFLLEFKEFFETDGRHHIWIGTTNNSGLLVYDQHNVIFAYGPIDKYKLTLKNIGFKEQSFSFPIPHCHNYHDDNDKYEKSILDYYDWVLYPLNDNDLYD